MINQFDPNLQVTIVDVTQGVMPIVLQVTMPGKDKELKSFDPNFETGFPAYKVPRFYAARLLSNCGGRKWILVHPNILTIQKSNGQGGSQYIDIKAHVLNADGTEWIEKTETELDRDGRPQTPVTASNLSMTNEERKESKRASKKSEAVPPKGLETPEKFFPTGK
jgi:hypothetical protein